LSVPKIRLGIYGVFGRGNFGNEATLAAFLTRIGTDRFEPIIFCEDPEAAAAIHEIPAKRIAPPADASSRSGVRRIRAILGNRLAFLTGSIRAMRTVDALVIPGTGVWERYGSGAFGVKFELWCIGIGARLARKPFVILNVGAEYLPRRSARFLVRGAGRAATYRSYRDALSRDSARDMGVPTKGDVVSTDLAFSLDLSRERPDATRRVCVGVMNYWGRDSVHETSHAVRERYAANCVDLVRRLRVQGRVVHLVGGDDEDLLLAAELAATLGDGTPVIDARSPGDLILEYSRAEVVVATRYHSLIMALLAGTPTVSIGYSEKHRSMLSQLGLPDVHFDIYSFEPAEVAAAVAELAADRSELSAAIDAGVGRARGRLDSEWPQIEAILLSGSR
jgi:polysaccharide pyruvyl transferase WcaK-like protein